MKFQVSAGVTVGVVLACIALGAGLTMHGLLSLDMKLQASSHLLRFILLWSVIGTLLAVASRWRRLGPLQAGGLLAVVIALAAGQIWPLFTVLSVGLSSLVLGRLLLSSRFIAATDATDIDCLLVGLVLYGTVVGLLAHVPVNYPGVYGMLLVAPVLAGWRHAATALLRARAWIASPRPMDTSLTLLTSAIAAIALMHFLVSLMPEVGHDALASHLFIPAHLAWRHEWGFDVDSYVWAVTPMLGDWTYSLSYMLAGETAARLTNLGGILLLAALVREVALWAGSGEKGALWAALLLLTTPLTFTESSSLFIESVWTCLVVGGALAILRLQSSASTAATGIVVAGVLLGGALAAKTVTFMALPVLLLLMLIAFRQWLRPGIAGAIAVGLALFLAIGTIPYLTAWLFTGNPVFPFFNAYFESPHYALENFQAPAIFERGMTWDVLYRITFESGKFLEAMPGAAGFQWLLLVFPALVAMLLTRHRRGLLLLAIAATVAWLTFRETAYLRYVFPSFALACAAAGVAIASLFPAQSVVARAGIAAALVAVVLNIQFFSSGTWYGQLDHRVLLSAPARDAWLTERVPIRSAVQLLNQLNRQETPVAFFSPPLTAGLRSDALYANWYNFRFQAQVNSAATADAFGRMLAENQVQYVILDDAWGGEEKRQLIRAVTQEIAARGAVSVRSLNNGYRFTRELLTNPGFASAGGWNLAEKAKVVPGVGVIVSVSSPASQYVPVVADRQYRYTATAKCLNGAADGRLQVNWLDDKSNMLTTDIQVFSCAAAAARHSMDVQAPKGAVGAFVYASGHTQELLVFTNISFRD